MEFIRRMCLLVSYESVGFVYQLKHTANRKLRRCEMLTSQVVDLI